MAEFSKDGSSTSSRMYKYITLVLAFSATSYFILRTAAKRSGWDAGENLRREIFTAKQLQFLHQNQSFMARRKFFANVVERYCTTKTFLFRSEIIQKNIFRLTKLVYPHTFWIEADRRFWEKFDHNSSSTIVDRFPFSTHRFCAVFFTKQTEKISNGANLSP